jgi:hypothetical protein
VELLPLRFPADCLTWGDHRAQGDQVGGGGEDGHIGADLADDVLGADRPDAVHGAELVHLAQVRRGQCLDGGGERGDLGAVVAGGRQHHRQHGGVLAGEERAVQRVFQPGDLGAHAAAGQLGQGLGVALPGGEGAEHVPAGDAVDGRGSPMTASGARLRAAFPARCFSAVRAWVR